MEDLAPADRPDENRRSLGFKLSYGNFDYGTFGDIPGRTREAPRPRETWNRRWQRPSARSRR